MGLRETLNNAKTGVTNNNRESLKAAIDNAPDDAIIVLVMTEQSTEKPGAMGLLTMANVPKVVGLGVLTAAAIAASGVIEEGVESVGEYETAEDCGDPTCTAHEAQRDVKVTPGAHGANA